MSTIKVTNISPQSGTEVYLTGSLIVSNILRAREVVTTISSSQVLVSGSTKFGDSNDDTHIFSGSVSITGSVSADDYTGTFNGALSSSTQIAADITGSWTPFSQSAASEIAALTGSFSSSVSTRFTTEEGNVDALQVDSGSFSTRLTSLEGFSSSLDDGFVTELELAAATSSLSSSLAVDIATKANSASFASDIAGLVTDSGSLASRITVAESELNNTLISGAAQIASEISGSITSFSASVAGNVANNTNAIINTSASIATDIAANVVSISSLTSVTGSYATSATHISIGELKALVSGSATYNDFTASVLAL